MDGAWWNLYDYNVRLLSPLFPLRVLAALLQIDWYVLMQSENGSICIHNQPKKEWQKLQKKFSHQSFLFLYRGNSCFLLLCCSKSYSTVCSLQPMHSSYIFINLCECDRKALHCSFVFEFVNITRCWQWCSGVEWSAQVFKAFCFVRKAAHAIKWLFVWAADEYFDKLIPWRFHKELHPLTLLLLWNFHLLLWFARLLWNIIFWRNKIEYL